MARSTSVASCAPGCPRSSTTTCLQRGTSFPVCSATGAQLAGSTIGCAYPFVTPTAAHQAPGTPSARPLPLSERAPGTFPHCSGVLGFLCALPLALCSAPSALVLLALSLSLLFKLPRSGFVHMHHLFIAHWSTLLWSSSSAPALPFCHLSHLLVPIAHYHQLLCRQQSLLAGHYRHAAVSACFYNWLATCPCPYKQMPPWSAARSVDPRTQRHGRHRGLPRSHL